MIKNLCRDNKIREKRNIGIDLLRIIAMFYIVVLHFLGHGGVLESLKINTIQYKVSWGMEIFAFCAVDVFAIISGYVNFRSDKCSEVKIRYSSYIKLWLEVVFYGIVISVILHILGICALTKSSIMLSVLPVFTRQYWYFTAYTGLVIFMPLLNVAIKNIDEKTLKKIFIVIITLFSIINIVFNKFELCSGYSLIWIVILYILGAIMKKCSIGEKIKIWQSVLIIAVLYIITYLYKMYGLEKTYLNIEINRNLLINYISPTILLIAIMHIIIFSKIRVNTLLEKVISFLAPSAFAVYIINDNPLIRDNILLNKFSFLADCSGLKIFSYANIFAGLFVICVLLVDKIRQLLFKLAKVDKLTKGIETVIESLLGKIIKIL